MLQLSEEKTENKYILKRDFLFNGTPVISPQTKSLQSTMCELNQSSHDYCISIYCPSMKVKLIQAQKMNRSPMT